MLGIRADTGGLTYESTTARDAAALTWLLRCGASQAAIAEFGVERISETQREILSTALKDVRTETYRGVSIARVVCVDDRDARAEGRRCIQSDEEGQLFSRRADGGRISPTALRLQLSSRRRGSDDVRAAR